MQGQLCGLCGNNNGDLKDDFTTRYSSVAAGTLEFGNSWKTSQECSDTVAQTFPCDSNPYCKAWAVRKCEIIRDSTFRECHNKVGGPESNDRHKLCPQRLMYCALLRWTPMSTMMRVLKKLVPVTWRGSTWDSARLWQCMQRHAVQLESVSHGENQISVVSEVHMLLFFKP